MTIVQDKCKEIVKLKNEGDELLAALKSMLTFYGMDEEKGEVSGVLHEQDRKLIAKIEEQGLSKKITDANLP